MTVFILKLIAMGSMLVDHTAYWLVDNVNVKPCAYHKKQRRFSAAHGMTIIRKLFRPGQKLIKFRYRC